MSWADLTNWAYQNRWWYVPLHIAVGATSWAWFNFSCERGLHEEFDRRFKELGLGPEDINKLELPSVWLLGIVAFAIAIVVGPLTLAAVVTLGAIGFVKLRRGLKFSP